MSSVPRPTVSDEVDGQSKSTTHSQSRNQSFSALSEDSQTASEYVYTQAAPKIHRL